MKAKASRIEKWENMFMLIMACTEPPFKDGGTFATLAACAPRLSLQQWHVSMRGGGRVSVCECVCALW